MALAVQEAELSEDKPAELLGAYLECMEPGGETWPVMRRTGARIRFEFCRLQMHHYMWGTASALFGGAHPPVDLFAEMWCNTLMERSVWN